MKKTTVILVILFLVVLRGIGQSDENIALKEYYADAEFFLAQEFYTDALHNYLEIYKRGFKENANINYKIGICYLNIPGQKEKSIEFLELAKEFASLKYRESSLKEKFSPIDAYLYLGNAYRVNNMVDKAIEAYKTYKSLIPADQTNLQNFADKQIEACNIANEFMHNPVNVEFRNLGPVLNTSNDDYKAVFSGDGNKIVYMHKLPFYNAVYYTFKVKDKWIRPINITPEIMSDGDQNVCFISFDGKTILLTKEDEFNSDIYISRYIDNRWTKSEPIGSGINTKYWESHASLSKDGKLLYFTSNRKDGLGDMDIWVSELSSEGTWSKARNLGNKINTVLNEDTPFITESGKTLYFSSQGFINMGGYDLFVSHLEGDTSWTVPENLGYPFSTTDDDLFYFPLHEGQSGYISKIMPRGYGGYDIYQIGGEMEEIFEPITADLLINDDQLITPELIAQTEVTHDVVIQNDTIFRQDIAKITEPAENPDGSDLTVTPVAVVAPVAVVVAIPVSPDSTVVADTSDVHIAPVIPAVPAQPGQEPVDETSAVPLVTTIEISPVFFDFNKTSLTSLGRTELDKIVNLMISDQKIHVVLLGYADALGPEDYNIRLSEQRAIQTMKYLVQKGIDATRLKVIGRGETNFIAPNTKSDGSDYPEARKFNRRVEFEISGIDNNTMVIKRIDPVPEEMQIQNK